MRARLVVWFAVGTLPYIAAALIEQHYRLPAAANWALGLCIMSSGLIALFFGRP